MKVGPFGDIEQFLKKMSHKAENNRNVHLSFSLVRFCILRFFKKKKIKKRKSFWLKQGLEPTSAGFALNRLIFASKSSTYRVSSVVSRKTEKLDWNV